MNAKIRTLLIDNDEKQINDVKKYFENSTVVEVTQCVKDGKIGCDEAIKHKGNIDLVIMDTLLPNKDCISILREFKRADAGFKIILTSNIKNSRLFQELDDFDVDYIILRPYDVNDLASIIGILFNKHNIECVNNVLEQKITKMLHDLGIPSHIKGYQYIREGVLLIYKNPYIIGGITKELYPSVAHKFKTTSSRVERAIRHAIEVSWNRGDYEYMEELFGHSVDYDRARPTNSEFIATVADKLRLEASAYNR